MHGAIQENSTSNIWLIILINKQKSNNDKEELVQAVKCWKKLHSFAVDVKGYLCRH